MVPSSESRMEGGELGACLGDVGSLHGEAAKQGRSVNERSGGSTWWACLEVSERILRRWKGPGALGLEHDEGPPGQGGKGMFFHFMDGVIVLTACWSGLMHDSREI